ncbi:MAG: hypothetical protein AAGE94_00415 [Acidobacteriota bacterium]
MRRTALPLVLIGLAAGVASWGAVRVGADLAPPGFDPDRIRWQALRYEAAKLFVSAKASVQIEPLAGDLGDVLIPTPRGRALAAESAAERPGIRRLSLRSQVLGRKSLEEVWFDGRTGSALQRSKLREGGRRYRKVHRHTLDGVFERRSAPADVDEAVGPVDAWSQVEERWIERPATLAVTCPVVLEPALLFYLLSAHPWWGEGDAFEICAFSKGEVHRLELRAAGRERIEVDYRVGEQRRFGEVEALRVTLSALPILGEPLLGERKDEVEAFELMELEGPIELFVDPELGAPIEIRGEMSPLGEVSVRLVGATLR